MPSPADQKDASTARAILNIIILFDIFLWILLIAGAVIEWININRLFYHAMHLVLWFLWFIMTLRIDSLELIYFTFLFNLVAVSVDATLMIVDIFAAWNCIANGTSCWPPPDTQFSQTLLTLAEILLFGFSFAGFLMVNRLTTIYHEEASYNNKAKEA